MDHLLRFSHDENEYGKAMAELRKIVPEDQYELLLQSSEDEANLN